MLCRPNAQEALNKRALLPLYSFVLQSLPLLLPRAHRLSKIPQVTFKSGNPNFTPQGKQDNAPHFMDGETEAQNGEAVAHDILRLVG